ncbi:MFS transporter [Compostibacillus humi]|uniref:MFS transporter n=1 Tax=Compostibacillus humi TaxID=1245525 RepID=A0A8J2ZSI7_9BACI|nr:MFS transporter [Compostibacillus humi]GGH75856.1 MFS transporter [Compostibacillus humi]
MGKKRNGWKAPILLLISIGISSIGNFIYLVAINIIVYRLTGSAAAVAGLWIVGPLTNIFTKFWTGSFIDYRSKRQVMVTTYLIRALFIGFIPFAPNIAVIYAILIILNAANAFFTPASVTYMTMLVPKEKRKRFNAFRSFADSGAFIVGPAVGGALMIWTSVEIVLWINVLFFIIPALLFLFLPEMETIEKERIPKLTISQVLYDFTIVIKFMSDSRYVSSIYIAYILLIIFTFAMDAQEVVFTQQVVGLTELEYSLLISITGIGSVAGAALLSIVSNRIPLKKMIASGLIMMTVGYVIYAFSWSFASVAAGFIILGFFHVFFNAGMMTFYQNNIPTEIMGRVTSIYQFIQSALQILFVLAVGIMADYFSLRITIVTLALVMLFLSIVFAASVMRRDKEIYFKEVV